MEREGERSHGGMETLEAAVPGRGAARERRWRLALDDAHHLVINVRSARDTEIQIYWMHIAKTITKRKRWTFVGTYSINIVGAPVGKGNRVATGRENEDAGGATSARRKNPPCKSLPAGTRVIGKEKERANGSSQ